MSSIKFYYFKTYKCDDGLTNFLSGSLTIFIVSNIREGLDKEK